MTITLDLQHQVVPTNFRAWSLAWLGGPVIGIANGVVRRAVYEKPLGDLAAHQVSTGTAIGLFGTYIYLLDRRWPVATARDGAVIGGAWLAATAAFEFGFGHYVAGASWSMLRRDWDLTQGRVWSLALLTMGVAPALARTARLRRATRR